MDIKIFTKILQDKNIFDYEKMKYKYGEDFFDFLKNMEEIYYQKLPLKDFSNKSLILTENQIKINPLSIKHLLRSQNKNYNIKSAEEEIISTSAIENIDFSRDSVRSILKGMAPRDEEENRILGIKKGLEFISDTTNKMTEENLYCLYMMTVGDFLEDENKLSDGNLYRDDTVYVISDKLEHSGLDYRLVPEFMKSLFDYINSADETNDLIKAAVIHFYCAYIHPYFDGNGRIARLLHLWFLVQKGYHSALFVPFSSCIEKSRKEYYNSFTKIEANRKISGVIDVTPFVFYFTKFVYNSTENRTKENTLLHIDEILKKGKLTDKEKDLLKFVLSFYGTEEFSTKQLEKDFGNAAYATIRSFVLKLEKEEILTGVKYGNRTKYKISE